MGIIVLKENTDMKLEIINKLCYFCSKINSENRIKLKNIEGESNGFRAKNNQQHKSAK